jgi:hypothetical protein
LFNCHHQKEWQACQGAIYHVVTQERRLWALYDLANNVTCWIIVNINQNILRNNKTHHDFDLRRYSFPYMKQAEFCTLFEVVFLQPFVASVLNSKFENPHA